MRYIANNANMTLTLIRVNRILIISKVISVKIIKKKIFFFLVNLLLQYVDDRRSDSQRQTIEAYSLKIEDGGEKSEANKCVQLQKSIY